MNNKKNGMWRTMRCAVRKGWRGAALALLLALPAAVQAQTDYSGTYYIGVYGSNSTSQYSPSSPSTNFYLCPTEDWLYYVATNQCQHTPDNGQPFLTSYKCRSAAYHFGDPADAVWIIEKAPAPNSDYYYIKQKSTGKYLVFNGKISNGGLNRIRVHLEEIIAEPGDNALFAISRVSTNNDRNGYWLFHPKNADAGYYLNITDGNKDDLKGATGKNDGPTGITGYSNSYSKLVGGTIGQWNEANNTSSFYLEDVITRPTIGFNTTSNLVEITDPTGNATAIYYTTDGTTPTIESTLYTAPFNPADNVTVIKAVAVVNVELSNVATFTTPVLCGSSHKYLIQSQNNAWNSTDYHFYLIPGDVESEIMKLNTTSLFRPTMEWHFLSAGVENGVQYYYIVNSNGKYLCVESGTDVQLKDYSADNDNKFKFSIELSTDGTFNIVAYGFAAGENRFLNKKSGNAYANSVNLEKTATAANSRWKFILSSTLDKTAPFTESVPASGSYSYYKIKNVGGSNYISPVGEHAQLTTGDKDNMKWYFEKAEDASASDWLTYYYIRNAVTGDYLCFLSGDTNARINSTITPGHDVRRYKFTWARSATDGAYYIVPKYLKDKTQNNTHSIYRYKDSQLQARSIRSAGDYAWTFVQSTYTCATPTIEWSDANGGGYVIRSSEPDARKWYTTNDGLLLTTLSGTAFDIEHPIQVANLEASSVTIRAIAARSSDGSDVSPVPASLIVNRVATPGMTLLEDGTVQLTCATDGVTFYYEMAATSEGVATPTTRSTEYSGPIDDAARKYIKVIAVKDGWINSEVFSSQIKFTCAKPIVRKTSPTTFTIECSFPSGAYIRYNKGANHATPDDPTTESGTPYEGEVSFSLDDLPFTVKAIAYADDYNPSEPATKTITANLNPDDDGYYIIANADDFDKFIMMVNGDDYGEKYKIINDFTVTASAQAEQITNAFTGELKGVAKADGSLPVVSGLTHALFNSVNGGKVHDLMFDNVAIPSGGTNVGTICNEATGDSRIYNCGVLGGTVGGTHYVGGLVGLLDGSSRVINCYSYATITGGSDVGGIVGYNNGYSYWTTGESDELHVETMVMNCMFYGDITGGTNISPVYGGNNINNVYVDDEHNIGLNTFNYYAYEELATSTITDGKYNCALAVEKKYLNRFEFYRQLLNSNKKLAAIYASTSTTTVEPEEMAKWVLETADRTIDNPKAYPILKDPGHYYPSIINPDFTNAPDSSAVGYNKGGKLGRTLSVTIRKRSQKTPGGQTWPSYGGYDVQTTSLTLIRTDKDPERYNFNYDKVQLPYYNDIGTGNYTYNRVVTGWKIVAITEVEDDPYTSANYPATGITDYPNHNYADRKSSNKDLYTVSGRVFSQGAYFDVPYGVTSITIEPYWGKAAYVADAGYDVVYNTDYSIKKDITALGEQVNASTRFNNQQVYSSISSALSALDGTTVYDNAVVLVGNLHQNDVPSKGDKAFTLMSVDEDNDHEPDFSMIYHHKNRTSVSPIRFDFLNIPGTAQAQKPNGAELICNATIFKTKGWFEITNTSRIYSSQMEYENLTENTKTDAPLILLGGVFDQFVSTQQSVVTGKTTYIHVGDNLWINSFGLGTHGDGSQSTPHVPVSVTGGEFQGFYLTGTYNQDAVEREDNAECYISGGHFVEVAGASQEPINGNVRWQIYNADIDNFYGGGTNDAKPVKGDVTVDIFNSHVTTYCGGPKFGNMQPSKAVTTNATGCVFGEFFGAGYGGLSYSIKKYTDSRTYNFTTLQNYYYKESDGTGDRGKYYDGITTASSQQGGNTNYGKKGPGVATDFDYEFFVWSTGETGVRFYVKFASFSLAQCNNVVSRLDKCIIDGNFYGGGSLGKVTGDIASELDNCIVRGNVFGAGYSASLPPIWVRDAGFAKTGPSSYKFPNFNKASGMFEPGVFSDSTRFEWKNASEAGATLSNGSSGSDLTNHYIYTAVDISKTNLGSVSGAATLTLKGNTVVGTLEGEEGAETLKAGTGNVYGGGDESAVVGNTTVNLQGNAHVLGNVFGGGNNGSVGGNSSVTIKDPVPEP